MTGTAERLQLTGMRLREQRAEMRAGRADRRTERLRHRVDVLQNELDHEREAREELMDIVRHEQNGNGSRRGGTLAVLVVGGAAYLLGAKAGRTRYEQIASWARRMRDRGSSAMSSMETSSSTSSVIDDRGTTLREGV